MKSKGFTLIEVMMVVAIIGIIAAVAIPQYSSYVVRGKIIEGTGELSAARSRMEQRYQDQRNYACTGFSLPATKYFTYTCDNGGDNQTFVITASGNLAEHMDGYRFTINQSDVRQTLAFPHAVPSLPVDCWLLRPTDTC